MSMFKKKLLMVFGPTEIEQDVLRKGSLAQVYNRTPEFTALIKRINRNLQYLFQTENPVFMLTCSGTGAMEAAILNTLSPGDRVLVVNGGTFGARWTDICTKHGVRVSEIKLKYGQVVDPEEVRKRLKADPKIKAVFTTQTETSTGTVTDIKKIGAIVKDYRAIFIVDAVGGLGVERFEMDRWNCDVAFASSQKALSLPPGMAYIAFSQKAQDAVKKAKLKTFYFEYDQYLRDWYRGQTPFTPAISIIYQLDERLMRIRKAGLKKFQQKYAYMTAVLRSGIKAMGLNFVADHLGSCVTGVWAPKNIDAYEMVQHMSRVYDIYIAPSPDDLKSRLFRIGNFGNVSEKDIIYALSCLEKTLIKFGYPIKPGTGVRAARSFIKKEAIRG